jgi:hypothetical protein
MGDRLPDSPLPPEINQAKLEAAVTAAFDPKEALSQLATRRRRFIRRVRSIDRVRIVDRGLRQDDAALGVGFSAAALRDELNLIGAIGACLLGGASGSKVLIFHQSAPS